MLSIRLLVNSRLFVIKFWESRKLYVDFLLHGGGGGLVLLTSVLFKVNCTSNLALDSKEEVRLLGI